MALKKKTKKKQEALTVTRLINEILVSQLKIPLHQIVNDKTFTKYSMLKRPDLLISNVPYDLVANNEDEYIKNLVAYAEVKDNCKVDDKDWKDAYNQGMEKSKLLDIPYFIVTNCNIVYFFNSKTGKELRLNGNPIREFQDLDVLNLIVNKLKKNNEIEDIKTDADLEGNITQTVFNKKLWELANIYRQIDFKNITEKIDFTIGFIALKYFEEKEEQMNCKLKDTIYWSDLKDENRLQFFVSNLNTYIQTLEKNTEFKEFKDLMEVVRKKIEKINDEDVRYIFDVIESLKELHGCGFDLFGSVYEMFASNKEKSDFGEYFTRRHYTHVFSKILLSKEIAYNSERKFNILDPACGTGGFLTEAYKVLYNNYKVSSTLNEESIEFLRKECIYGIDVRQENVSRTKLNMFLVGDGHTHILKDNTLELSIKKDEKTGIEFIHGKQEEYTVKKFDYILTNPPYGNGNIEADTNSISTIRLEIAFIVKIIKMLKDGGEACIIIPDGFFENPSFAKFRKEVMEMVNIKSIVSLPKFAFAPYTKEKTYALFIEKRPASLTKIQSEPIWMYIIDNDGFANSDKRFPTKLKNSNGSWKHDEISSWVSTEDGESKLGILEERWRTFDDIKNPTVFVNEKGEEVSLTKGGFINMTDIKEENHYNLLPEFHLRKVMPDYITFDEFDEELNSILDSLNNLIKGDN
ncbi:MAG: SAM-dependent methyltransferase [Paeniclostridium sp.]|nr:N-6 DNA methylase [Paeniclostridium sp.]MBW4862709.1 SAM-dependent methyltransferase [Paeniclostridium sp.]MBW4874004.1 SAM-dependent methyltransferase [Paeniclostridium sp.]